MVRLLRRKMDVFQTPEVGGRNRTGPSRAVSPGSRARPREAAALRKKGGMEEGSSAATTAAAAVATADANVRPSIVLGTDRSAEEEPRRPTSKQVPFSLAHSCTSPVPSSTRWKTAGKLAEASPPWVEAPGTPADAVAPRSLFLCCIRCSSTVPSRAWSVVRRPDPALTVRIRMSHHGVDGNEASAPRRTTGSSARLSSWTKAGRAEGLVTVK
mmetsp:Transcript_33051/g.95702  ORF Transcript_33051/g.95702 Transcript_33051/m.95702 type:complete len:213 (+) Transcript_33051:1324-1962(+)